MRDLRAGALIDQLRLDLAYAVRLLTASPAFTATVVATLALGIGANAAIFSVVDTVVFRALPYKDPEHLVKIWTGSSVEPADDVSMPEFLDIQDQNETFEAVAADDGQELTLTPPDGSRDALYGAIVTASWLSALGVQPALGRGFVPDDFQPGRGRVVILTHACWTRHFRAEAGIVGQTLAAAGGPITIVGVLPPNVLRYNGDFLQPLIAADYPAARNHRDLDVFARLRAGVTLAQARARLATLGLRLEREYPATNKGRSFSAVPLGKYYAATRPGGSRGLLLMLGAVGLVFLIACANVANLLLARAVTRARECVIRTALGASRARLIRQVLLESVVVFLIGGAVGILLARWSIDSLLAFAVAGNYVPERLTVALDVRVLAFGLCVSLAGGIVFGLIPALHASRVDLSQGLRASAQTLTRGLRRSRVSRLLIVSELAVSLVLLIGSGLMIRSFLGVHAATAGIVADNLLETSSDGGRSFPEAVSFWRKAIDETRRDPGVQFASVTSRPPVHGARQQKFAVDRDAGVEADDDARAGDILVSEDYFRTMGIPLLKGRAFSGQDTAASAPVVIVSESLARRYFGDRNPLGKRVSLAERSPMTCCTAAGPVEDVWREIVGVAADVRQNSLEDRPAMTIYRPYSQIVEHDMYLMVRARSFTDTSRLALTLRSQLLTLAPGKDWTEVQPMRQILDASDSIRIRRFILTLLGSFACLGLMLAAVGTYGVLSYSVAERTREIGIRVALGATTAEIVGQVLRESMRLTAAGLGAGVLGALLLTRLIAAMLFGVSATDAATYLGAAGVLASVALLAGYLPARRAARVDPLVALRHE